MQGLNVFFKKRKKKASSHVIEKELPRSLLTSFDCLLGYIINRHNVSSWPENGMEGYSARTLPSPADVEQIELETPSVRGSVTSWVSCCDTGLDLPQRKSHRKVCINTILPPCLEGSTRSTTGLLAELRRLQMAAGKYKCGAGLDSSGLHSGLFFPAPDRY